MKNIYEPEYVKDLFNQMSGSYERMNYVTSFGFSIRWRKQFLNKLGTSNDKCNVIDLLSGLGENWKFLKQNFPNAEFYALDFSEEMIRQSAAKAKKVFDGKANVVCMNVLKSSLPADHFDIVSCAYGLKTFNEEHLIDFAKEIKRILKPGGKFSFVEVSKPGKKFLRMLFGFYLGRVIPVLGKIFLGNPQDYKMLWIYTNNFSDSKRVKQIFEQQGLQVAFDQYFYGCATGISGNKIN